MSTDWAKAFGPGNQLAAGRTVAIDGGGNVVIGGDFQSPIDPGEGSISNGGSFIAGFGPSGTPLWSKGFGNSGAVSSVRFVVPDGAGGVIAAGTFTGTVDCGGGPFVNSGNTPMLFVARLDSGGNHVWSKSFGDGTDSVLLQSMVLDGSGVLLAGTFATGISFGGATLAPSGGGTNGDFLAVLDLGTGAQVWSKGLPSTTSAFAGVDSAGNIVMAGAFTGSVDFGGGPLASAGGMDIFVAGLDPSGNYKWAEHFGGTDDDALGAVAVDPSGNVALSGIGSTSLTFGGAVIPGGTTFLVVLGPTGEEVWTQSLSGNAQVDGIAADGTSGFVVAGAAIGDVTLGTTDFPSSGSSVDLLVFKVDPSGDGVWMRRAGGGIDTAYQVAVNAGHVAAVTGIAREGDIDFGTGDLSCTGVCAVTAVMGP